MKRKVTDAGRPTTRPDGLAFIEQYIVPSLEVCKKLQMDSKIIVGGPVGGSMKIVMVMDVESIRELDELLEDLPISPRTQTTVSN